MPCSLVPSGMVDQVWPHIAEGMATGCRRSGGDLYPGWLWTQCRTGNAFLFIAATDEAVEGASVWQFETWPNGPRFRCLMAAGEGMGVWFADMRQKVEETARQGGAVALVSDGRTGWERHLPKARKLRTLFEEPL